MTKACNLWLAEDLGGNMFRLLDGCHSTPQGVAKAERLHRAIWPEKNKDRKFVMLRVSDVPAFTGRINEEAAESCRSMIAATPTKDRPWIKGCHADRDGDCSWVYCPQNRDGEPLKSGRHCPLDVHKEDN